MKNTIRHDKKALKCHISLYKVAFFMIICLSSILFLSSNTYALITDKILQNFNFDNNFIDNSGNYNATNSSVKTTNGGLINEALNFTGISYESVNLSANIRKTTNANYTINLWMKSDETARHMIYASQADINNFIQIQFNYNKGNNIPSVCMDIRVSGVYSAYCDSDELLGANYSTLNNNNYHMITYVFDKASTRGLIYIDGILQKNSSITAQQFPNFISWIGQSREYSSLPYNGLVDEFSVWNRSLNQIDITKLYNYGYGVVYPFLTPTNLTININYPPDNSVIGTAVFSGINFTYINNINNSYKANCTLYVNETFNNIVYNINSSNITNINWTNKTTGIYPYYINCTSHDNISQTTQGQSETRTLIIDLFPPTYIDFANNATNITPRFNQTINWSITLMDNFNISYYSLWHYSNGSLVLNNATYLNGSFIEKNISTITNITAPKGYNVCGLYVFVDTAGNINFTPTLCFLVKNTPPRVILDKPANNSNLSVNFATFNWTATDIDINDTNISQHNLWMSDDGGTTYILKYNGINPTIFLNNLPSGTLYWLASSYDGTDWGNSSIFKLNIRAPVLNITARDYASNASITSFTAILTAQNGTQIIKSTSSKSIIFNLTYEIWNYTISTSGYTDSSGTINMIDGSKNLTIYMQFPATINVNIYNENNTLANGILTSLLFISETQAYSVLYTTSNGTKYIPYIPSDSYQLKYNASNYRNGVYYLNINTTTSAFIKLYLIPINNTNQIFITLYDINGNVLEGYIIKALRFNTGTNNWEFYQMSKTDGNGIAIMFFTPFDNYYQFVVEKDGIVYLATTARLVYGDFSLIINPSRIDVLPMLTAGNIAYNLSYDNSGAGFFRFQYNDLNSIVVRGCLNVKNPLSSQYLCSQCSESTSAVLICNLNASNSSVLLAQAVITYLNDDYTIATLEKNFTTDYQTFGAGGIFYVALLVLALSLLALWHPIVAIAMAIIAMLLSGIIGLFYLTFTAGVVLVILGLIYMVLMRK